MSEHIYGSIMLKKCFAGFFNITSLLVKRQRGKSNQCFFVESLPNVTGQKFFLPFFSKGQLNPEVRFVTAGGTVNLLPAVYISPFSLIFIKKNC